VSSARFPPKARRFVIGDGWRGVAYLYDICDTDMKLPMDGNLEP